MNRRRIPNQAVPFKVLCKQKEIHRHDDQTFHQPAIDIFRSPKHQIPYRSPRALDIAEPDSKNEAFALTSSFCKFAWPLASRAAFSAAASSSLFLICCMRYQHFSHSRSTNSEFPTCSQNSVSCSSRPELTSQQNFLIWLHSGTQIGDMLSSPQALLHTQYFHGRRRKHILHKWEKQVDLKQVYIIAVRLCVIFAVKISWIGTGSLM